MGDDMYKILNENTIASLIRQITGQPAIVHNNEIIIVYKTQNHKLSRSQIDLDLLNRTFRHKFKINLFDIIQDIKIVPL